jgi:tripartite-type tricarboxylate transporter receptor subunit TctC
MGVAVTVENMAGSDGAVGTTAVAKAAPDGYTLLATSNRLTIAPHLAKQPSYDPVKDFVPVARIAVIPLVLVTSEKSPFKTFDGLVDHMRQNPWQLRYATSGTGELSHLEAALMNRHLKLEAKNEAYGSGRDALAATAGGKADFFLANYPMAAAQINKGSLRALAVTSNARMPRMSDVPTLAEATRRPGYEAIVWFGLLAPAGTDSNVLTRLENELEYELEVPEVRARIEAVGGQVAFLRSAPFAGRIKLDYGKWGVVKSQQ